ERADLLVPAAVHDLVVDPVPLGDPPGDVGRASAALGQPDRAVERDPALEAAIGEVLAAAAGLPDSLVGPIPVVADPVDDPGQRPPAPVLDLQPAPRAVQQRVHRLTVDVELQLVGGAVADPDRPRAPPALEVVEVVLGQVGGAVHPVHDLQRAGL